MREEGRRTESETNDGGRGATRGCEKVRLLGGKFLCGTNGCRRNIECASPTSRGVDIRSIDLRVPRWALKNQPNTSDSVIYVNFS